jgi:hypothetical protein
MISATFLWSPAGRSTVFLIGRYCRSLYFSCAGGGVTGVRRQAQGKNMKIYLLMVLIGTLLTAIRFTSVLEQQSKTPLLQGTASGNTHLDY